ncbi:MAG TPA: hypothetical protein VH302_13645 [Bryobacteraceae bacterium]|jgi:hypothetical protein|nr:hypothetical protein [Bryobacteraceae bacterium]
MAVAWLITLLAIAGVFAGVSLGASRMFSPQIGAAGGGLLVGVALFWVLPEIAETSSWLVAVLLAIAASGGIAGVDELLMHAGHSPRSGALAPLLAATGIHCFLDGWSVRALGGRPMTDIAVALGLALHKIPEGFALGWVIRRASRTARKAVVLATGVELLTALAAYIEPRANSSAVSALGSWWTTSVLAVIAGAFLFFGFHVVIPERHKRGVVPLFTTCFVLMAAVAWFKG